MLFFQLARPSTDESRDPPTYEALTDAVFTLHNLIYGQSAVGCFSLEDVDFLKIDSMKELLSVFIEFAIESQTH